MNYFKNFPIEIFLRICEFLDNEKIVKLLKSSKKFYDLLSTEKYFSNIFKNNIVNLALSNKYNLKIPLNYVNFSVEEHFDFHQNVDFSIPKIYSLGAFTFHMKNLDREKFITIFEKYDSLIKEGPIINRLIFDCFDDFFESSGIDILPWETIEFNLLSRQISIFEFIGFKKYEIHAMYLDYFINCIVLRHSFCNITPENYMSMNKLRKIRLDFINDIDNVLHAPNLEDLTLSDCYIKKLPNLKKIKTLVLKRVYLEEAQDRYSENIESLEIDNSPDCFEFYESLVRGSPNYSLKKLEIRYSKNNIISRLNTIYSDIFCEFKGLRKCILSSKSKVCGCGATDSRTDINKDADASCSCD